MRANKLCASARCGCRSSPFIATRSAASSWPLRRNASPSPRNTRLWGSWASWAESARMSSAMAEHSGRLAGALHVRPLRLFLGAASEPLPVVPTGDGFGEATHRDERKSELAMRRGELRIEPQRAPQLLGGGGPVTLRQMNPAEQQMDRRVVRLHAPRLLGGGARRVEVLRLQGSLGLGHKLGRIRRAARTAPLCRPGVHQHDHAGTFKTEQRLGHLEVGASELRRQPTDGSLAVDERQHFPLRRQQVELAAPSLGWRRERRHDAHVRNPVLDARPLVDAARALHQERLDGNADRHLGGDLALGLLGEGEVALVPAHHLEDDFLDLEADLALDLALRDHTERHEDLAESALVTLTLLHVASPLEIGLGDLAGAQQQRAERVRVAADLRRYDDAVVEVDLPLVVAQLRGDAQRSRLPAQVEQLEDVVDPELA